MTHTLEALNRMGSTDFAAAEKAVDEMLKSLADDYTYFKGHAKKI